MEYVLRSGLKQGLSGHPCPSQGLHRPRLRAEQLVHDSLYWGPLLDRHHVLGPSEARAAREDGEGEEG